MQNSKRLLISGLLLASLLLGVFHYIPKVSAVAFAQETFEDDAVGSKPTGSFYTNFHSGPDDATQNINTQQAHSPTKSWKAGGGASDIIGMNFSPATTDLCGTATPVDFWVFVPSAPADRFGIGLTSGGGFLPGGGSSATALAAIDVIGSALQPVRLYGTSSTVANGAAWPGGTFVINSWNHFNLKVDCTADPSDGSPIYVFTAIVNGVTRSTSLSTTYKYPVNSYNSLAIASPNTGSGCTPCYLDDVSIGANPLDNTRVAVTNLVGFDIERNGNFAIARTDGGDFVRIYSSLLTQSFSADTNCLRTDGVSRIGTSGFAYFICNSSDASDIQAIAYRDTNGNNRFPVTCVNSCNTADFQFDLNPLADENDFLDLTMPYDSELDSQKTTIQAAAETSRALHDFDFTVTGLSGNIYGLSTALQERDHPPTTDKEIHEDLLTYAGSVPEALCNNQLGKTYVVDTGTATVGYQTNVLDNYPAFSGISYPMPTHDTTTSQVFTGPGALTGAADISCSQTKILVGLVNSLVMFYPGNGTTAWTKTVSGLLKVSLSGDGKWASYSDLINTYILNGTNGNLITSITNPTGTLRDTELDYFGQKQYIASSVFIQSTNIVPVTTITPVGSSSGGSTTSASSSSGGNLGGSSSTITNPFSPSDDNPFGLNMTFISEQLHISHEGVAVLIGLIFVVIFTIWLYRGTGSPLLAILGAGLGLMVATLFAFINVWVLMVVVLFLIVILGKMIFGGFTGGEEN